MPLTPQQIAKIKDGPTKEAVTILNSDVIGTPGITAKGSTSFSSISAGAFSIALSQPIVPDLMDFAPGLAALPGPVASPSVIGKASKTPFTLNATGSIAGAVAVSITSVAAGLISGTITGNTLVPGETAELHVLAVA